jgi:hypothetical protein
VAIEILARLAAAVVPPLVVRLAGDQLYRIDFPLLLACTPILLFCVSREFSAPLAIQKAVETAGNMTFKLSSAFPASAWYHDRLCDLGL